MPVNAIVHFSALASAGNEDCKDKEKINWEKRWRLIYNFLLGEVIDLEE